jgi:hypothetical protein
MGFDRYPSCRLTLTGPEQSIFFATVRRNERCECRELQRDEVARRRVRDLRAVGVEALDTTPDEDLGLIERKRVERKPCNDADRIERARHRAAP